VILQGTAATYATAYDASRRNRQFQETKRSTRVALRVYSHVACLLIMFCFRRLAMPFLRRENVRHATLFFCAKSVNARGETGVEESEVRC
jgi:hypothetical protein